MTKISRFAVIVSVLIFVGAGCTRPQKPTTQTNNTTSTDSVDTRSYTIPNGEHTYHATLEDGTLITMVLEYKDGIVQGTYKDVKSNKERIIDGSYEGDVVSLGTYAELVSENAVPEMELRFNASTVGSLKGTLIPRFGSPMYNILFSEVDNSLPTHKARGGHYVSSDNPNQYIDLLFINDTRVKLQAHAEWQGVDPSNVHVGDVDAFVEYRGGNTLTYTNEVDDCTLELTFTNDALNAIDNGECGGANVSLNGTYRRISHTVPSWSLFENLYVEGAV